MTQPDLSIILKDRKLNFTEPTGDQQFDVLLYAQAFVRSGFHVLPLHCLVGDICSCGDADCSSPGKHPRTLNGVKGATDDGQIVEKWFAQRANLGVATGNGVFVVDVDMPDGNETLFALEQKHGALPTTFTTTTGRGGTHYWFTCDKEIKNSTGKLGPCLDIRAAGGYVVAPPSVTEQTYAIDPGQGSTVAAAPEWLVRLVRKKANKRNADSPEVADAVIEGGRNGHLISQGGAMRRRGFSYESILAALMGENEAKCSPPLSEAEVITIAKSAAKYEPEERKGWERLIKRDGKGHMANTAGNLALCLMNMSEWKETLTYDEFRDRIFFRCDAPSELGDLIEGREVDERAMTCIQHWMSLHVGPTFNHTAVAQAVAVAAARHTTNELRDWALGLEWDREPRIDTWLSRYLGATEMDIHALMGRWWMISVIARALKPGAQVDHMLILEGRQGVGKSSVCRILGGDFFMGQLPNLMGDRPSQHIQGASVVEVGELESFRGAAATRVKDFLTQTVDTYRKPYSRDYVHRPRTCVFVGTTNSTEYLDDASGGRRFWPVSVTKVDIPALKRDREQLFAEAKYMYDQGELWHPRPEDEDALAEAQEQRRVQDIWHDGIREYCQARSFITVKDILINIGFDPKDVERRHQIRCGRVLHSLGYRPVRIRDLDGKRIRGYKKLVEANAKDG